MEICVRDKAILKLSKDNAVISQNEEKLNAVYGPVARHFLHTKLTSGSLDMIQTTDTSNTTTSNPSSFNTNIVSNTINRKSVPTNVNNATL